MSQNEKKPMRSFSGLPFYLVLILILIVTSVFFFDSPSSKSKSLSDALDMIENKAITKVIAHGT